MKRELWKRVKVGDQVLYASEYQEPTVARISVVDIRITVLEPELHYDYPYGRTEDTGTVKISYDEVEAVENLKNLMKYSSWDRTKLLSAYNKWRLALAGANALKEDYLERVRELRAK